MNKFSILVAVGGVGPAWDTANHAVALADRSNAELIVLHVARENEDEDAGKEIMRIYAALGEQREVPVTPVLEHGDLVPAILDVAHRYEVAFILMGLSPGHDVATWLSSDVLLAGEIPVVVIPRAFDSARTGQGSTRVVSD